MTLVVSLILCWVIVEDLRRFRIRNVVVLALAASFVGEAAMRGSLVLLLSHGLFALVAFGILSACFALRAIGGGDVKLLSVALLWVGPEGCATFAAALLCCTVAYLAGTWIGWLPERRRGGRRVIPYGPSIAAAWLFQLAMTGYVGR